MLTFENSGRVLRPAAALWMAIALLQSAHAQTDRVYYVDGKNASGKITVIRPEGVQIKKGSSTTTIRVDEISRVLFQGTPSQLTQAVQFYRDAQYQSAIDELAKIDAGSVSDPNIQAEIAFFDAASKAEMAVAGRGSREEAVRLLTQFVSKNRNSYHLYPTAELLGDLAMVTGGDANHYYNLLVRSGADSVKRRGAYLSGRALAAQGKHDDAIKRYDYTLAAEAGTSQMAQLQSLATAAKAESLAAKGSVDDALALIKGLIAELDPNDPNTNGHIYNAFGAVHQASGNSSGALLAYLRTHLMFAADPPTHARALSELVKLWNEVGRADRSAATRGLLKQLYPGY